VPLHVSSTCVHHQQVSIALHSLWYHHTRHLPLCIPIHCSTLPWKRRAVDRYAYQSRAKFCGQGANVECNDTRDCVMQFWPADDEHMCSKHVEAWNKLNEKQKFCASSWLITEINILRYTFSKTSKDHLCSTTYQFYITRLDPHLHLIQWLQNITHIYQIGCIVTYE